MDIKETQIKIDTNIIIPGETIGGIYIGTDIFDAISQLKQHHDAVCTSENSLLIDNGLLEIYYDADSYLINMLSCNEQFTGKYKNKLWAGMTVADVIAHSKFCMAWAGFVEVDGISGIGLPLPDEYDDFDEITDFLDYDYMFKKLYVY